MQGFTAFLIYISIFVKQKGIAMKTTAEIIEILRDYNARSAEKYGIETLGLFGSVARGEQNEKSDIDVFIKLRKTSYYTLMDIKDDLEQVFRQKVDLIDATCMRIQTIGEALKQIDTETKEKLLVYYPGIP